MAGHPKDLTDVCEIIKDRLYFCTSKSAQPSTAKHIFINTDEELRYEAFYADFGPLNLGNTYLYCTKLFQLLTDAKYKGAVFYHVTGTDMFKKPNAAFLIGAFSVIYLGRTPEAAFRPMAHIAHNMLPYRDASYGACSFKLTVLDCLRGLHQAMLNGFVDFSKFDLEEYQFYERVENGDLNWIVPGKLLAFAGPHNTRGLENGYPVHCPDDYFEYFKRKNVEGVVRLNNKVYDRMRFVSAGFGHHELFFVDGSIPPDYILAQFLDICERTKGALAVHCKAGLGRTGTLIACYMMKHFYLTAAECIAWLRIARPGSVLGPQQYYLQEKQTLLWRAAERIGTQRRGEADRPEWARELTRRLEESGLDLSIAPDLHAAAPHESLMTSLASGLRSMGLTARPRNGLLPPLAEPAAPAIDTGPGGQSQGDYLMQMKAVRARPRSYTTDALKVDGQLPRARNTSVAHPVKLGAGGPSLPQPAPLKATKVVKRL